jgi:hypothetical protein
MTSQIISETVDENFPVAGQDNDSQGFRDNFNIVKTGLGVASSEITDLQGRVLVRDPDGTYTNNLGGNQIIEAEFKSCTFASNTTEANGPIALTGDANITFATGYVHVYNAQADGSTLTFRDLPTGSYAPIRLVLSADSAYTINFAVEGGATIYASAAVAGASIALNATDTIVLEAFSYDATKLYLRVVETYTAV